MPNSKAKWKSEWAAYPQTSGGRWKVKGEEKAPKPKGKKKAAVEEDVESAPINLDIEQQVYPRNFLLKLFPDEKPSRKRAETESTAEGSSSGTEDQDMFKLEPAPVVVEDESKEARVGFRRELRALKKERKSRTSSAGTEGEMAHKISTDASPKVKQRSDSAGLTTMMLRNIPNQYTRQMLQEQLAVRGSVESKYNFLYLPIDRSSERNMGYAFINFRQEADATTFVEAFNGVDANECLPGYRCAKTCEVRPADLQGVQANMEKMRQPSFLQPMMSREDWQPLFLDEEGKRITLTPSTESSPKNQAPPKRLAKAKEAAVKKEGKKKGNNQGKDSGLNANAQEFIMTGAFGDGFAPFMPTEWMYDEEMMFAASVHCAQMAAAMRTDAWTPVHETFKINNKVRKQIEYYLSEKNLEHDLFLRSLMDAECWVPLASVLNFGKMKALGADKTLAVRALAESHLVEISADEKRVRSTSEAVRAKYPHCEFTSSPKASA